MGLCLFLPLLAFFLFSSFLLMSINNPTSRRFIIWSSPWPSPILEIWLRSHRGRHVSIILRYFLTRHSHLVIGKDRRTPWLNHLPSKLIYPQSTDDAFFHHQLMLVVDFLHIYKYRPESVIWDAFLHHLLMLVVEISKKFSIEGNSYGTHFHNHLTYAILKL